MSCSGVDLYRIDLDASRLQLSDAMQCTTFPLMNLPASAIDNIVRHVAVDRDAQEQILSIFQASTFLRDSVFHTRRTIVQYNVAQNMPRGGTPHSSLVLALQHSKNVTVTYGHTNGLPLGGQVAETDFLQSIITRSVESLGGLLHGLTRLHLKLVSMYPALVPAFVVTSCPNLTDVTLSGCVLTLSTRQHQLACQQLRSLTIHSCSWDQATASAFESHTASLPGLTNYTYIYKLNAFDVEALQPAACIKSQLTHVNLLVPGFRPDVMSSQIRLTSYQSVVVLQLPHLSLDTSRLQECYQLQHLKSLSVYSMEVAQRPEGHCMFHDVVLKTHYLDFTSLPMLPLQHISGLEFVHIWIYLPPNAAHIGAVQETIEKVQSASKCLQDAQHIKLPAEVVVEVKLRDLLVQVEPSSTISWRMYATLVQACFAVLHGRIKQCTLKLLLDCHAELDDVRALCAALGNATGGVPAWQLHLVLSNVVWATGAFMAFAESLPAQVCTIHVSVLGDRWYRRYPVRAYTSGAPQNLSSPTPQQETSHRPGTLLTQQDAFDFCCVMTRPIELHVNVTCSGWPEDWVRAVRQAVVQKTGRCLVEMNSIGPFRSNTSK